MQSKETNETGNLINFYVSKPGFLIFTRKITPEITNETRGEERNESSYVVDIIIIKTELTNLDVVSFKSSYDSPKAYIPCAV